MCSSDLVQAAADRIARGELDARSRVQGDDELGSLGRSVDAMALRLAEDRERLAASAALYRELFERAAADGFASIACEVNLAPPNPVSDAFHDALGFMEVGRAVVDGGPKTVRYLMRPLGEALPPTA